MAFDNLDKFSSVDERQVALNLLIKEAQINQFPTEYFRLQHKQYVGDGSKLKAFNPALNKFGQIIALTRLDNLDADLKELISLYPIILPPEQVITNKIIMKIHKELKHSNIKTTLSLLRAQFVLVHARKTVKRALKIAPLKIVDCPI